MDQKKYGVAITYMKMAFSIIVSLIFTPFMLSRLGDSEYGIYSLSSSLITFIALLDLGLGQTMIRYLAKAKAFHNREDESKTNGFFLLMYSSIALVGIIVGVILINVYPQIARNTLTPDEAYLFKIVFFILLIDTAASFPLSVFSSNISASERYLFLRGIDFALYVLKYGILVLVLCLGYKVIAFTLVTSVISITTKIIYLVYSFRILKVTFTFRGFEKEEIRGIFQFSFFIMLNMIVDFLYNSTDKLILGAVSGTIAVTIYSFGVYFQAYFQQMSTAISGVFFPQIVRLYEQNGDMKAISTLFLRVGRIQMTILFLALSGFITFGREFILLWIGESYGDSYIIGLLIMVPAIIPLSQNVGISILRAMNIHKYRSYMYMAIAVLNVIISIPLAMRFNGIGAAIGTLIANLLGQILFMNLFYKFKVKIDIAAYWKDFAKFALATAPLVLAFYLLKSRIEINSWLIFAELAAAYAVLYGALFWFVVSNDYEKSLVKRLFKRLKRS